MPLIDSVDVAKWTFSSAVALGGSGNTCRKHSHGFWLVELADVVLDFAHQIVGVFHHVFVARMMSSFVDVLFSRRTNSSSLV